MVFNDPHRLIPQEEMKVTLVTRQALVIHKESVSLEGRAGSRIRQKKS